jgi:hypothetical protein
MRNHGRTRGARLLALTGAAAVAVCLTGASLATAGTSSSAHHARGSIQRSHPRWSGGRLPRLMSWNFTTTFNFALPGQPFPVGSSTLERIVYDPRRVDADGNVVITGHQHYLGGAWADPNGPAGTPVSNRSIFNVKTQTLSYDIQVTHGVPIVLVYTPYKITAIYSQTDGSQLEGGTYAFDPAGPQPCNARTWYQNGTC